MLRTSNLGILALAFAAIIASHVPYALGWYPPWNFVYLPLPVVAICLVLVPQRRTGWLIAASIATFIASAFAHGNWRIAGIDIAGNALAVAALGWVYGFRQSRDQRKARGWMRLTRRLRRQSEQLRASDSQLMTAIKTQHDAQQAYLQSEAERQTLLEHLPVYVLQKDLEGRFTFATQSFCKLLNRGLLDILGKTDFRPLGRRTAGCVVRRHAAIDFEGRRELANLDADLTQAYLKVSLGIFSRRAQSTLITVRSRCP